MRALPLTTAALPPGTALYRVQRPIPASGPSGHAVGAVHLPAMPARRGRFDLAGVHVAAFALDPEAAVYETIARATARAVSLSLLCARELLQVQSTVPLNLLDACAQHQGAACVVLFDKPVSATATVLTTLSSASAATLHLPSGSLHAAVLAALIGSQLPLLP